LALQNGRFYASTEFLRRTGDAAAAMTFEVSDHDDDGMQKKSENVAHAQDGIKLSKLKNSGPLVEFATDIIGALFSY
jgi:hypothetical protein